MTRRAARTYQLGIGLGLVGVALALGALGAVLVAVSVRSTPAHQVRLLGQHLALPGANAQAVVLLSLATLGIAVVLAGVYGGVVVAHAHRRLRRSLAVIGHLPGPDRAWIVQRDEPAAFCAGLLRPAVYVTSGAVAQLDGRQLEAVLAHEQAHRARRDPVRIACARVLGEALFFLPAVRRLTARYCVLAELAADQHAVTRLGGDRSALAGAMLAFEGGIEQERIDQLSGRATEWGLPIALTAVSLAGAAALALLVWQLARHAVLHTTLALPLLSGEPCVVMLALVPFLGAALGIWTIRRAI